METTNASAEVNLGRDLVMVTVAFIHRPFSYSNLSVRVAVRAEMIRMIVVDGDAVQRCTTVRRLRVAESPIAIHRSSTSLWDSSATVFR